MAVRYLTDEQEREVIALYLDPAQSLADIRTTYGIGDSVLYRVLKTHHVSTRAAIKNMDAHVEVIERSDDAVGWIPRLAPLTSLTVQTDANGVVERVERDVPRGKRYVWEVRFESAMRVEAATISEAIAEVERLPVCRRVFGVALKGAP